MTTETSVKERPILFSGPMVQAILEGNKTMTRRVIKPQPDSVRNSPFVLSGLEDGHGYEIKCPYQIGMKLWVRETWNYGPPEWENSYTGHPTAIYKADHEDEDTKKWKPSIFMPRWASRITLEITGIKVERLQSVSEEDAKAEGVDKAFRMVVADPKGRPDYSIPNSYRGGFVNIWEHLNGDKPGLSWQSNPWVWCISFRRVE